MKIALLVGRNDNINPLGECEPSEEATDECGGEPRFGKTEVQPHWSCVGQEYAYVFVSECY